MKAFLAIALAVALFPGLAWAGLDEDPGAVSLPLEIEINGESRGEVIVRATPSLDVVELQGSTLKELVRDIASEEVLALIEALPEGFASLESYRELGIEIDLDLERLVIRLSIQERRETDPASVNRIQLGYQRKLNYDQHERQANLSAYANLRWRTARIEDQLSTAKTQSSLGIDHVVNVRGYAIEGESVWSPSDGFETKQIRIVRDFPQRLWRASFGDISTPITDQQRGAQIFGFNLVKEFGIQPYRAFTPTGSASFELAEQSTVFVTINGRYTRSLRLEPGMHSLEDFKLAAGPNSMKLEIRSDSGVVDHLDVNEFGSLSLLGKGVDTYAFSFGLPRAYQDADDKVDLSVAGFYERYLERDPLLSGYYRKGIHNQMTAAVDFQGSSHWARAGVSTSTASERFGEIDLSLSLHRSDAHGFATATKLNWRRNIAGFDLSASTTFTDRSYNLFSHADVASPSSVRRTTTIGVSKLLDSKINFTLSAYDQARFDGSQSRAATLSLGQRFQRVYANLSLKYSRDPRMENMAAFLSLTWSPATNLRTRSQIRYDRSLPHPAVSTTLDYSNRKGDAYTNASLSLRKDSKGYGADALYTRRANRYSASLSHREVYDTIDAFENHGRETSLAFETAFAYADGSIGMAQRIRDSFAIIDRHPAWRGTKLGINPTYGGYEKTMEKAFFKPTLSNLPSYREGYATIQTVDSDLFLERNDFYFFPGYHRGTRLLIGDEAIYSVRSQLFFSDGTPVAYRAIQLQSEDGTRVNTFTNHSGRFMAIGLTPGRYLLKVADSPESTEIEVAPNAETLQLIDSITLRP